MCVTFVTCEVRVCGLRCRSGSSLFIYRVYCALELMFRPIPKYMKVYAQWAWVCIAMHYPQ